MACLHTYHQPFIELCGNIIWGYVLFLHGKSSESVMWFWCKHIAAIFVSQLNKHNIYFRYFPFWLYFYQGYFFNFHFVFISFSFRFHFVFISFSFRSHFVFISFSFRFVDYSKPISRQFLNIISQLQKNWKSGCWAILFSKLMRTFWASQIDHFVRNQPANKFTWFKRQTFYSDYKVFIVR